jgi:putative phosphoesterase
MKIVFFSDIHGNKYSFEKFIDMVDNQRIDLLVFCGDIFGYYYYQNEIIDVLRCRQDILSILGNHDQLFLNLLEKKGNEEILVEKYGNSYKNIKDRISEDNIGFLKKLPEELILNFDSIKIGVFHGTPTSKLEGRFYPDTEILDSSLYEQYDYVILGHTHHKMIRKVGNTTIINPGSLGQQRDGKGCSFLVLDTFSNTFEFQIVTYDISKLVDDIKIYDSSNERLIKVLYRKSI